MTRKYLEEQKTPSQISKELGVSQSAVRDRLRELDLLADRTARPRMFHGQVPFGWKKEHGSLVPHKGEQKALAEIRSLRATDKSLRGIANLLNSKSIKSKNGQAWHPESVRRALQDTPNPGGNSCNQHSET